MYARACGMLLTTNSSWTCLELRLQNLIYKTVLNLHLLETYIQFQTFGRISEYNIRESGGQSQSVSLSISIYWQILDREISDINRVSLGIRHLVVRGLALSCISHEKVRYCTLLHIYVKENVRGKKNIFKV